MYAMSGFHGTHSAVNGSVIISQTHCNHHPLPSVKVLNTLYDIYISKVTFAFLSLHKSLPDVLVD